MARWSYGLWYVCVGSSVFTAVLGSSVDNHLHLWFLMEINLVTFLVLVWSGSVREKKDYVLCAYFVSQAKASALLLAIFLHSFEHYDVTIFTILMFKAGAVPFHSWYYYSGNRVNCMTFFFLCTSQKIIPLQFMSMLKIESDMCVYLCATSVASALILVLVKRYWDIIIFSSCLSMNWLAALTLMDNQVSWPLFMIYSLGLAIVLMCFCMVTLLSCPDEIHSSRLYYVLSMMGFSGLPPSPYFAVKLLVFFNWSESYSWFFGFFLLLSAMVAIYGYVNLYRSEFVGGSTSLTETSISMIKGMDIIAVLTFYPFALMLGILL